MNYFEFSVTIYQASESNTETNNNNSDDSKNKEADADFQRHAAGPTYLKPLLEIDVTWLDYNSVKTNAWVAVNYANQYYLGKVLKKAAGEYLVRCLALPYGTRTAQDLEKDSVFCDQMYNVPILPCETDIGVIPCKVIHGMSPLCLRFPWNFDLW